MVFSKAGIKVVVAIWFKAVVKDRPGFGVLLEVLHVGASMAALERSQITGTPVSLLAFPEQVLAKGLGVKGACSIQRQ